jgi:hypothetical protein
MFMVLYLIVFAVGFIVGVVAVLHMVDGPLSEEERRRIIKKGIEAVLQPSKIRPGPGVEPEEPMPPTFDVSCRPFCAVVNPEMIGDPSM